MSISFRVFSSAEAVGRDVWNALALRASPMAEWEYFYSLEESGSVSEERGYRPCHLAAYAGKFPIALAPLYERDRAWVEFGDGGLIEFLTEITGLPFHLGLVGSIPYTPAPGYEFLRRPDADPIMTDKMLLDYIDYMCRNRKLLTSRIYFVSMGSPHLHSLLRQQGYMSLRSQYYLWFNRGYGDFDDYLKSFRSSRRTKIKRELRTIREQGIRLSVVDGKDAPAAYFDDVYQLYLRTWTKHMGLRVLPFLNGTFFELLGRYFRHRIFFSLASLMGGNVGMALFYHKAKSIFGRYWGCFDEVPFLHFATCYYHPIQYAIENGVESMDPGFGGEHKLIRGYEVVPIYHYIKFHGERPRRMAVSILQQMREISINDVERI